MTQVRKHGRPPVSKPFPSNQCLGIIVVFGLQLVKMDWPSLNFTNFTPPFRQPRLTLHRNLDHLHQLQRPRPDAPSFSMLRALVPAHEHL